MSFLSALGHYFEGFFKGLFGQLKTTVIAFLSEFVKTDVGALAIDAVTYAGTLNLGSAELRDAAVTKLKDDLTKAGKDVTSFSTSLLNFFIESALQGVKGGIAVAETEATKL